MAGKGLHKALWRSMIKENEHWPGREIALALRQRGSETRRSSTAAICSRVTSNCSITSSTPQVLKVLDDGRNGQASISKHPCSTDFAGDAFHGGTLGSLKSGHVRRPPYDRNRMNYAQRCSISFFNASQAMASRG